MSELGILPNPIPFGKYYLLERVNIGGMAEIFKAKAFGVDCFERMLAIKKILEENGFGNKVAVLSYSVKFSSSFWTLSSY